MTNHNSVTTDDCACPWCGETEFDRIGLKDHLTSGDCADFDECETIARIFAPTPAPQKVGAVTDEQVEIAAKAWFISEGVPRADEFEWLCHSDEVRDEYRRHARSALLAALSPQEKER